MGQFASQINSNPGSNLAPFGTLMSAIGSMVSANTAQKVGTAQQNASYFTAQQQDQNANNVVGAGQRMAMNEDMKAKLLASRALAVASANGGDAGSPGVQHVVADIAGQGAYNAGVALYDAEDKARLMRMGATASRFEGDVAAAGGQSKAAAYMIGGAGKLANASSLFAKYGQGGPKKDASPTADWSNT